jgi:hypothetical protein
MSITNAGMVLWWYQTSFRNMVIIKVDLDTLCMQNTCINFVVYWCIFLHIIMLLVVLIMICNDLWGFSIDPPYFGDNSAEQENSVCVFLCFRNLPELKLKWDFLGINILSREPSVAREVNEGGHDGQSRPGGISLDLGPQISSIFIS